MTIDGIMRANREAGRFFFAEGAMKGFNSIVYDTVYGDGYFITSEQFISLETDYKAPRTFKVRKSLPNGHIQTVSDSFETLQEAQKHAKELTYQDALAR